MWEEGAERKEKLLGWKVGRKGDRKQVEVKRKTSSQGCESGLGVILLRTIKMDPPVKESLYPK